MNQTMKQYDTLFKRYWDEAEYYARLYGIEFKKDSDGAWDEFRHAYASAAMSRERSPWVAHAFGNANEILGDRYQSQYSFDKHMDRWNNAAERRLAEGAADNDEIAIVSMRVEKRGPDHRSIPGHPLLHRPDALAFPVRLRSQSHL